MIPTHGVLGRANVLGEDPPSRSARHPSHEAMFALKNDAFDNLMWASAQGNALAKLEIFHKMAKSLNDQQ